jgi:hypothetical protein
MPIQSLDGYNLDYRDENQSRPLFLSQFQLDIALPTSKKKSMREDEKTRHLICKWVSNNHMPH